MSLSALQNTIVRLALFADERARFVANPSGYLAPIRLSDRERRALASVRGVEWDRYANSLIAKRADELVRVFPRTVKIAPSLRSAYSGWLRNNPPRVLDDVIGDETCAVTGDVGRDVIGGVLPPAVAEGLRWLENSGGVWLESERFATYAADLARFEAMLRASHNDGRVRSLKSRFAIPNLAKEIGEGTLPLDPECEPTEIRFSRTGCEWRRMR